MKKNLIVIASFVALSVALTACDKSTPQQETSDKAMKDFGNNGTFTKMPDPKDFGKKKGTNNEASK